MLPGNLVRSVDKVARTHKHEEMLWECIYVWVEGCQMSSAWDSKKEAINLAHTQQSIKGTACQKRLLSMQQNKVTI